MPKVWNIQSNFTSGEIDPRLIGRVDLAVYYNACRQARNVTPLIQGGMSRRDGSEFIDTTATECIRLLSFQFSTEEQYLLAFADSRCYIYKDGTTLQTNIAGTGNDYLTTSITAAQLVDYDFVQTADYIIGTHPENPPVQIIRTSDTFWTITTIPLTNVPQFDYDDGDSPAPTSNIQTLTFANQNTSDRFKLSLDGILSEEIIYSNDLPTTAENIESALYALPNTANSGVSVLSSGGGVYVVTFSGSSAADWPLISGAAVLTQSASFSVSAVETQAGVPRDEDVWSAGRGWPRTTTFHEGRLWFGGSASRPQTLWGSVVNDFFNFDAGRARDDEGIDVTLDTDQVNAIQGMISNRSLQVFTTGQEFFVPSSPITPENVAIVSQSNFGSKRVRPITIDGRTIYFQRTGKAIREFSESADVSNQYKSNSITILSSHIVVNPIRMTATRGSENIDANYAYFVNSDGTILVYNVLGAEGIVGFTLWDMGDYLFTDAAVVNDELFGLVANGSSTHIARMNSDRVTDLGVKKATPVGGVFTGLDHLDGETVVIVGDGAYEGTAVVSGGQVTVDDDHTTTEVGLLFTPVIETMPLNQALQNGPNFAEPKKVNRVTVDFYESLGMIIKNSLGYTVRIADKTMGVNEFDNPTPQTGRKDIWLMGWDNIATVTITQEEPVPMTILTIAVEVGVQ